MWIVIGFAALGFLIGNLVGLTASSVVTPLLGLLFTFVGGTVLSLIHKIGDEDRRIAGASIIAISVCCLAGIYLGILTTENRWLSPRSSVSRPAVSSTGAPEAARRDYYLRAALSGEVDQIDRKKQAGTIKTEDAYEQIYRLAVKYEEQLRLISHENRDSR